MLVPGVILTAGALLAPSVVGLRAGRPLLCGGVLLLKANMLRVYGHLRTVRAHLTPRAVSSEKTGHRVPT